MPKFKKNPPKIPAATEAHVEIQYWPLDRFVDYARNPRKNDHVIDRIVASLREYGFTIPVLAKSDGTVIDGHLRLKGARKLELKEAPVIVCDRWTDAQVKSFRLLANRSATWADWDMPLLTLELTDLSEEFSDLDVVTGFDLAEIEKLLLPGESIEENVPAPIDTIQEKFDVLVTCDSEQRQAEALDLLQSRNYECRALIA